VQQLKIPPNAQKRLIARGNANQDVRKIVAIKKVATRKNLALNRVCW
jgi:hypothetical protein